MILEKIASVWQLEILLALYAQKASFVALDELSRALRLEPKPLLDQLHDLQTKGLAVVRGEEQPTAAYYTESPEQDRAVEMLAEAFRARPMAVIRLIYSRTDDRVRTLADAFRIKNNPKESPND